MQLELSSLIASLGQAVQEAQEHLERYGSERFCAYFRPSADANGENSPALTPHSRLFALPDGNGGLRQLSVPEAALAHHSTLALDTAHIRLNLLPTLEENTGRLLVEVGPGGEQAEARYSQLELTFRAAPAAEGVARLHQHTIRALS